MGIEGARGVLVTLALGCSSPAITPPADAGSDVHDASDSAVVDAAPPTGEFLYAYSYNASALLAFSVDLFTSAVSSPTSFGAPAGSGGIVAAPSGKFLYVSDGKSDAVEAFSIDAKTGALTPIAGSPFSLGNAAGNAGGLAIDPTGQFLYATDWAAENVVGFSIEGSTGALTRLQTSPSKTGTDPLGALVDPRGRFL